MHKGKYIVIEGAPGVGKTTVIQLIAKQLQAAQLPVRVMREPASQDDLTARAIHQLTQDPRYPMTTRTEVLLYNAARSQSLEVIREVTEQGVTCLVDRSYLTTLAIQYYGRGDVQDYQKINDIVEFAIGGMRPDLMVVLDAPVSTLRERAKMRASGERFDNLDEPFLERVRAGYLWEAKQRNLPVVYANEGIETVFKDVWQQVAACLAVRDKDTPDAGVQSVAEVLAAKPAVKVAAVEPPLHGAALDNAIAEPIEPPSVPTSDADIPPQPRSEAAATPQFAGIHLTIPDITKLAANLLDWDGVIHLEQHPIGFDHKESSGHYRYYIPSDLKGKLRSQYVKTMDQIFGNYTTILETTLKHLRGASSTPKTKQDAAWLAALSTKAHNAAQSILPLATKTTVDMFASAEKLQDLTTRLQASDQAELRQAAGIIRAEARNIRSDVFGQSSDPKRAAANPRGADSFGAVQKMTQELLPPNYADSEQAVRLANYSPHNELDIVADLLYPYSDLTLTQLQQEVAGWPYQRKLDVFNAHMGDQLRSANSSGSVLEKVRYTWDLVSGFDVFCELTSRHVAAGLAWQTITPRMGYETPALIEEAGMSDLYDQCFDLSLELHSTLRAAEISAADSQYAALLGHKLRWQVTYSAAEAFGLHKPTATQALPSYHRLVQQMHEKLAEIHPLLAEAMKPSSPESSP